jgi:hypothetical protein
MKVQTGVGFIFLNLQSINRNILEAIQKAWIDVVD